jgi:GcrA cell cycle regulator
MILSWTEAREAQLRELWLDGMSARLIGDKLGVTKGSVVGKAHRLGLPGRGSPIRTGGPAVAPRKEIAAQATGASAAAVPLPAPESEASVPPTRRALCAWIEGEKGVDFKFYADAPRCGNKAKRGSSYCEAHHARCWVKPWRRKAA